MLYHCHLRHDSKITQRRDLFPNLPSKIAPPPPKRKEKEKEKKKKKKRKRKRKEKTDSWRSCYVYKSNAVSKFCLQSCLLNALAEIKTYLEDMPRKLKKITVWGCFFISVIKEIGKLNWSKYRWSCILNGSYFVGSWKINYRSKYNKVKG